MRMLNEIIVHCSATRPSADIGADEIRHWHVHGNNWSDIGYHYVIRRNGELEEGRPVNVQGAHTSGHNKDTIGVCLVGGVAEENIRVPENNFTEKQFVTLTALLKALTKQYGITKISGHRDYAAKACPSFDVQEYLLEHFF